MDNYILSLTESAPASPTLHVEWCPEMQKKDIVNIGSFAGSFTAMLAAKQQYSNAIPCPYCCGALFYSNSR